MERIISDVYLKKGNLTLGTIGPQAVALQQRFIAVNTMYSWLYELGILEKVSFVFKDYPEGTHFALDTKDLEPYRTQMEQCLFKDAKLAVQHIFDEPYTPCMYSGAIQLCWIMSSYRDVDGCVGRSWECERIQGLDTKSIYDVLQIQQERGAKEAVKAMYDKYNWLPTLSEKKDALTSRIQDASLQSHKTKLDVSVIEPER